MSKRFRAALAAVAAVVVTMTVPQLAQAAEGAPAHAAHQAAPPPGRTRPPGRTCPPGRTSAHQAAPAHQAAAARAGTASGSDASCPAASKAAAGSATIGAPQQVTAIGGSASATVVWCPPASGAGSVVSYTVTSSGGQQVTAVVPNDWAIVEGLSNGTSYTFMVRANTASGASGATATSHAVRPAPIAPPSSVLRGSPQKVGYDQIGAGVIQET